MRLEDFETFLVDCPHCGETVEVSFERDVSGELTIDCEVCCRPWKVRLRRDPEGVGAIEVEAES
jgi:hypothetical protein